MKSDWEHEAAEAMEWDRWLELYAPKLLLFARQQTRCEADAHDVLQDAIVEAWRRQAQGEPPPIAVVFSRIRHRAIDLARREDRRVTREAVAMDPLPQCWFDDRPEDRERNLLIEQAMSSLPETYREVLTLKVWGDLTFAQIAEVLMIPANTAASRYRYGLAELRKRTLDVRA